MDPAAWSAQTDDVQSTSTLEPPPKVQRLEELDFSKSDASSVPSLDDAKDVKVFRIVRKDGIQIEEVIRISKKECGTILAKIGKRFKIAVNQLAVHYSLLTMSGDCA